MGRTAARDVLARLGQGGTRGTEARAKSARQPTPRAVVLALASGTMIGIFVARLALQGGPDVGLTFLLAVPVAMFTREIGAAAGAVASTAALGLVFTWAQVRGIELGFLGYCSRTAIFVLVVLLAARRPAETTAASPRPTEPPPIPQLTPREQEVLALLASGHTNRQVADELVLSVRTVEAHRARIQAKLGCSGRAALFRHAAELRLLEHAQPATSR